MEALRGLKKIQFKLVNKKENVQCNSLTIGRKNLNFLFRTADLYFIDDALIIAGYYNFFKRKAFRSVIILTREQEFYMQSFANANKITTPTRLNLNSSNNDVYIEFGEASFSNTNVQIWLKNLTEIEKSQIKFTK
ncbi:hypothetical protein [Frigoriflavimonas asaccharolytica]|uniref:Uncharacterized protein n=1 Tax=Frigoriflavimonas asaccharolytica TaxID=2735899 RepID=A0A8J8G5Z8_9FLAO|nr:hypothetical protein [Frigoriflavimonas asaccharolytica]NRS91869.1 hypothetical protein [Frigoriflavimonas asaccharolytica]